MSGIGADFHVFSDAVQGGRNYMEDVLSVQIRPAPTDSGNSRELRGLAFFGVFDGHGGADAAHFAEKHLLDEITRREEFWSEEDSDVVQAIKDGFIATHHMMSKAVDMWPRTITGLPSTAGTTASVVMIRNKKMYVAHVGDSAVVIGEQTSKPRDGKFIAKCITEDHKPESSKERARIENCGGEVLVKAGVSRVVWKRPRVVKGPRRRSLVMDSIPFLAVARSLGDLWSFNSERGVYVVSPEPDVAVFDLDPSKQRCLILASDGVWNMLSATDAIDYVSRWHRNNQLSKVKDVTTVSGVEQPAAGLVRLALDRWLMRGVRADNISAIVVMLLDPDRPDKESKPSVVRSATSRFMDPVAARARFARRRFCRSSLLRAALNKLWRAHATRNHVVSRTSCGVRGVLLPIGTCDRLDTPPPPIRRDFRSTADLAALDDTNPEKEAVENAGRGGVRRRHSYATACGDGDNEDDDDEESVHTPKRMRCDDDIPYIDDSPSVTDDEHENVPVTSAEKSTGCGLNDEPSPRLVEPSIVWKDVVKLSTSNGDSWKHRPIESLWSKGNRPICLTRTRLQAQRVCDG